MADTDNKTGPLTLAEVAAKAGVSIPTVSKVLNRRSDVALATRERVEQIIAEHGYTVNRAARSLRKGHNGQIDFIVASLNSDYATLILRGVEEALTASDTRVVLSSTHDFPQREDQWLSRLADGVTDGAILVGADASSLHSVELKRRNLPFVVVDPMAELGAEDLSVSATNWAGGKAATQYLIEQGHRRIATLQGPADFRSTRDRVSGYQAALQEVGLAIDPVLVVYGDWQVETAYTKTLELLEFSPRPTAIFAGTDQQALGVYRALYDRNVRIPESMSVVGFDDMPYSQWLAPALTTVRQPLTEMGRVATKMLLRLIAGEAVDTVRVELATPLIKRNSAAPLVALG